MEDIKESDPHVLHLGHRSPGSFSPTRQGAQGRAGIRYWPHMFAMNNVDTRRLIIHLNGTIEFLFDYFSTVVDDVIIWSFLS
jgi:hypothetical protein